jgi:hypothetical protein
MTQRLLLAMSLFLVTVSAASAQTDPAVPPAPPAASDAAPPPSAAAPAAEAAPPEPPPPAAAVAPPAPAALPAPEPTPPAPEPRTDDDLPRLQLHGFVSEGGFVSTANQYIGESKRGTLKFFDAGLNVTMEPVDQLRIGVQIVARRVGSLSEDLPRIDWAVVDYRLRSWLGLRAGVIKIPLGLYNEYEDIDSARTAILMPQGMYPLRNRDATLSQTGFAAYGSLPIGGGGELDYQAWLGVLAIPRSALELVGATLDSVETRYATGAQLFWRPPIEGLRLGGSYMLASIDFNLTLDAASVMQLITMGALPADSDGKLVISQRPTSFWVGSIEFQRGNWLFAAEYSRWLKHQQSTLPMLLQAFDEDSERFYGLATYRLSRTFELGTYYSVTHADVNDRLGHGAKFAKPFLAYQRDLAASLRIDVNDYWLWKVEGHFIDGAADLLASRNPNPKRYWGLFLLKTTATF